MSRKVVNYVVFKEKTTGIAVSISIHAYDYPDFQQLESEGYYERIMEGRKGECDDWVDENNGILSAMAL